MEASNHKKMASKDLHSEPFDESTIAKLEIFEDYAQAWIPTFVMSNAPTICVFDFFAGTGYDKLGKPGSPIRILSKIKQHIGHIFQKKVKVILFLNEFQPDRVEQVKFAKLKSSCEDFLEQNQDVKRGIELRFYNKPFEEVFYELLPIVRKFPSLVYLDQNGIKFLSDKYFLELEKSKQTDFLYFVSASYFWRFGSREEFKVHLDIDMSEAKRAPYKFIHRSLIEQLRKKLPVSTKLRLYPFSIKKGANIYGIIFGASHPRAVDKFLSIAWKRNEINGQANFDIDEDAKKTQLHMFDAKKLTNMELFQLNVREKIISGAIVNNFELLDFAYEEGHLGSHAAIVLKAMKKQGIVAFTGGSPGITYGTVYKNNKKIVYRLQNE